MPLLPSCHAIHLSCLRFFHLCNNPHLKQRTPEGEKNGKSSCTDNTLRGKIKSTIPGAIVIFSDSGHFHVFCFVCVCVPFNSPPSSFLPVVEYSWNGAHHELLLTSPGRRIDIIKKPIKARAGAFITVICEGLGLMGCLFLCAGLTAVLVYCQSDADRPHPPHLQHTRG